MKISKRWFVILLVLLVFAQRRVQAQPARSLQLSDELSTAAQGFAAQEFLAELPQEWLRSDVEFWVGGEILVGRSADQSVQAADVSAVLGYQPQRVQTLSLVSAAGNDRLIVERWRVPVGLEWATIATLQNQPGILFAEPNWIVHAAEGSGTIPPATHTPTATFTPIATKTATPTPMATGSATPAIPTPSTPVYGQPYVPNDPLYLEQQWYLQRINAPRALALLDDGSGSVQPPAEIVVAVIDSGIDLNHPEFAGRLLAGFNFWDNSSDPNMETCQLPAEALAPIIDDFGHGSHVAGLIGAALNNQTGIASAAPFVKLQPLKILNSNGSGTVFDLASAITYAANCLDVNIINLSLEISASVLDNNPVLNNTLRTAVQLADAKNVLLIAAGGNSSGSVVPYPAAYAEVMGVAALNINNGRASYSTTGSQIDIAAPGGESSTTGGVRIYSTWSKDATSKCRDGSLQELDGGNYCNDHGTSMATPLVVSVAALVWSVRPQLNAHEVRDILLQTATTLSLPVEQVGAGRVDAHAALRRALRSDLTLIENAYFVQSPPAAQVITLSARLENPSLESIAWSGKVISGSSWLSIGSAGNKTLTGTAYYAAPSFFDVLVNPVSLAIGEHKGSVNFQTVRTGNSAITKTMQINLLISTAIQQVTVNGTPVPVENGVVPMPTPTSRTATASSLAFLPLIAGPAAELLYLPLIVSNSAINTTPTATVMPTATPSPATPTPIPTGVVPTSAPPALAPVAVDAPFQWELPTSANERTFYAPKTDQPVSVTLPVTFSFPMRGQVYNDFRLFNDGYIAFPANEPGASAGNHCLLDLDSPGQAIYGWWTTLDAAAVGSEISTFMKNGDRFVVEFKNVPTTTAPTYKVSFQIVLFSNGDIRLNYLATPTFHGRPLPATVGIKALNGRFGFQIACSTQSQVIGALPQAGQSFLIKAGYLF